MSDNQITAKGAIKGTFLINARTYIVFFITLIINLYTSTILPIGDIGIFNLVTQFTTLFTIFIIFGFTSTISKYLPKFESQGQKKEANATVFTSLIFNCGIALITGFILIVFSRFFSELLFQNETSQIYAIYLGLLILIIPNEIMGQIFIVRYNFGRYLIPFFTADIIAIVSKVYFLVVLQNIDAYFYSAIISEGIKYFILFIEIFITFGRPTFGVSFKMLLSFSFPLFIGNIINYLQYYISNLIIFYFTNDLNQMGIIYYINIIYTLLYSIFSSLHNVLVTYYAQFLYTEKGKTEFNGITNLISKFFQILSFSIGFGVMLIAPFYIKFITVIFHMENLFSTASIALIFYGFVFLALVLYYIPPIVIHLSENSKVLLILQAKTSAITLPLYLIMIPLFGLPGIPLVYTFGIIFFIYLCKREINKAKIDYGFDKEGIKKILIATSSGLIIIPVLYLLTEHFSESISLNLIFFRLDFPYIAFFIMIGLGAVFFFIFLIVLRQLRFIVKADEIVLNQVFSPIIVKIISKLLIKNSEK